MAVMVLSGVIGKVLEVFPFHSNVQLISDPLSRTGVFFQRINVPAILEYRNDIQPLVHLPLHHAVEIGDTVRTSGLGGIYPKGLFVGRVVRITPENDLYKLVEIELHRGVYNVENVFVLNLTPQWQAFSDTLLPKAPKDTLTQGGAQ